MPELPEVEVTKLGLMQQLHHTIIGGSFSGKKFRYDVPILTLDNLFLQKSFQLISLNRRAKYLTCIFQNKSVENQKIALTFHLGMSGTLTVCTSETPHKKHDHLVFSFNNGKDIRFNDPRRFGFIRLFDDIDWNQLGKEPFTCSVDDFYTGIHTLKTSIKAILLSGKPVVGAGNIYACESLFRTKINPEIRGCDLTLTQATLLLKTIQEVLQEAITLGGSTLKDFQSSTNQQGYFQTKMLVYGQEKKPCIHFHETQHPFFIERLIQNGRSTFLCRGCQV